MCRYLHIYRRQHSDRPVISCDARHRLYLPSLAELESLCLARGHEGCPIFQSPCLWEDKLVFIAWPGYPFQEPGRTGA